MGLPFAEKIRAVTPINEEIKERMLFSGDRIKEATITAIEESQRNHSNFVKYVSIFFIYVLLKKASVNTSSKT